MRVSIGLAIAAVFAASPAAAETTKSFEVAARIVAGCAVATDGSGRLGTIDLGSVAGVNGTSVEATLLSTLGSGLSIECTPGVSASLLADNGDHPVAGERYLQRAGGGALRYRLYANGSSTPWTTAALPLTFVGGARIIPMRAVATLTGPTAAGTYTDTVRVTLTW